MFVRRGNWREDFEIIRGNGFVNAAFDLVSLLTELAQVESLEFPFQIADLKRRGYFPLVFFLVFAHI